MRISDWSSDVCSSDLRRHKQAVGARVGAELHVPVERAGQIAAAKAPLPLRRRGLEAPAIKAPLLRSGRGLEAPAIQSPSPAQREREARDRKSTRLNSSHSCATRMQSSAGKQKNQ